MNQQGLQKIDAYRRASNYPAAISAHGLLLTAGLFGGALLAGLLGRKRGKRQPDKRQSKERARAVPRRKRR